MKADPVNLGFHRAAVLLLAAAPFVLFVAQAPWAFWLVPLLIALTIWAARGPELRGHAVFWGAFAVMVAGRVPWPLLFILPLALVFGLRRWFRPFADMTQWATWGGWDKRSFLMASGVVALSSSALVLWFVYGGVDVSDIVALVPEGVGLATFLAIAFVFSIANAWWEEFLLKGMMWDLFARFTQRMWIVNLSQAFFFGLAHFHGFPRGLLGVAMAGFYGWMMGIVRQNSRGMAPLVITHFFADLTICLLIYSQYAGWLE